MRVLIVSLCDRDVGLLEEEFVKPVERVVEKFSEEVELSHYKDLDEETVRSFDKIILTGTSLKDKRFSNDIKYFTWLETVSTPVLGICAGAQVMGLLKGGVLKDCVEIGMEVPDKWSESSILPENLGQVYLLHTKSIEEVPEGKIILSTEKTPQMIEKENFYMVLFHPEVRNEELIENFLKLGL